MRVFYSLVLMILLAFSFISCGETDTFSSPDGGIEVQSEDYTSLLKDVDSTCFESIGYDKSNDILVVKFLESGSVYIYYEVPVSVYKELRSADSIGGYYNNYIKGQYISERIE